MSDAPSPAADDGDLPITLGVEEEFFLVDPESLDLLADPDPAIFKAAVDGSGPHKVVREFLRSQIETNTRVCGLGRRAAYGPRRNPAARHRGGRTPRRRP